LVSAIVSDTWGACHYNLMLMLLNLLVSLHISYQRIISYTADVF